MAPVPQGHYQTREELLDFAKKWAKEQGYAIVISRSRSNRLWLKCDRGGKYENRRHITDEQRKRKRGDSRLMGCPFMVMAVLKDDVWKLKTEVEKHNHEASGDLTAHPSLRKMTKAQMSHLEQMTDAGSTPAEIMDALKIQWPEINIVKRDVYNARKKHKENKRTGGAVTSPPPAVEQPWEDPNGVVPGPTATGKWVWAEAGDELVPKGKRKRRKVFIPNPPTLDPELQDHVSPQSLPRRYSTDNLASTMGFQDFATSYQDPSSSTITLQPNSNNADTLPSLDRSLDRSNSAPNPLQQLSDFSNAHAANSAFSTISSMDDNNFFSQNQHQRNSFPTITTPYVQQQQQQQTFTASRPADHAIMTPPPPPQPVTTRSSASSASAAIEQQQQQQPNGARSAPSAPAVTPSPPPPAPRSHNGKVLMSRIERMEKEQRDQKNMLAQILGAVTNK